MIGVGSIPSLSSPEPTDPDPPIPTVRLDFSIHPPALMGTERIHRGARRRIQSDRKGIPGPIEREGVFPIEGREGRTSDRAAQPTRALLPAPLQRFEVHHESMSVVPGSPNGSGDGGRDDDERGCVREQDRFLPIANISRIMKRALPSNAKIAKDAKETVQECVSEYISFITSEYVTQKKKRCKKKQDETKPPREEREKNERG